MASAWLHDRPHSRAVRHSPRSAAVRGATAGVCAQESDHRLVRTSRVHLGGPRDGAAWVRDGPFVRLETVVGSSRTRAAHGALGGCPLVYALAVSSQWGGRALRAVRPLPCWQAGGPAPLALGAGGPGAGNPRTTAESEESGARASAGVGASARSRMAPQPATEGPRIGAGRAVAWASTPPGDFTCTQRRPRFSHTDRTELAQGSPTLRPQWLHQVNIKYVLLRTCELINNSRRRAESITLTELSDSQWPNRGVRFVSPRAVTRLGPTRERHVAECSGLPPTLKHVARLLADPSSLDP